MLKSYYHNIISSASGLKRKYQKNIVQYTYLYNNFAIKKLIGLCTDSGKKNKIENIFNKSIILLKYKKKKNINLVIERSFSYLTMLIGSKLVYSGTKKNMKESVMSTYQQNIGSVSSFTKYMQTTKHKKLTAKIYHSFLELSSEKGYLLAEKRKRYVLILKNNIK